MSDELFAIAVKREKRSVVPSDWVERLRQTRGVTIMSESGSMRLQIRATSDALSEVEREFAEYLHIEPLIQHDRS